MRITANISIHSSIFITLARPRRMCKWPVGITYRSIYSSVPTARNGRMADVTYANSSSSASFPRLPQSTIARRDRRSWGPIRDSVREHATGGIPWLANCAFVLGLLALVSSVCQQSTEHVIKKHSKRAKARHCSCVQLEEAALTNLRWSSIWGSCQE